MKAIWLIVLMNLLVSCTVVEDAIFEVDPEQGSFWYRPGEMSLGLSGIEINGPYILKGAFLFHAADSLMAINSRGELDIISVFKGDSAGGTVQIIFINQGEENQAIRRLRIFTFNPDKNLNITEINAHRVEMESSDSPGTCFRLQTESHGIWDLSFEQLGDSLACVLNFPVSSVVLLPEEKLTLPPLEFFYHLCPH